MFRNTYRPEFYKQLHRYVHKTYRRHLAIQQLKNLLSNPVKANFEKLKKAASLAWYFPAELIAKQKLKSLEQPAQ
jgi:hypothetical protein